jgi:DNA-binding IclR family transcriptional regulator
METVGRAGLSRNRISQSEPQNRPPGARRRAGDGTRRAGDSGVGVLDRSMSLLQLLGDGPRTLRSLAQASGLPRPTAHRLLVALEVHGLVGRTAEGAFRLGPRLTELALRAGHGLELGTLAAGVLTRLHDQTGESVQLYLRSGDRRLCVAARDAGAGLRDSVPLGALLPLDAGSGGKVLLAWSDDASRFPAAGPDELAAVRRRGWASSVAEREPGVASVSAPVLRDGALLGALCVSGPVSRLGSSPGRRLAPVVVAAARELAALATVADGAPAPSATATPRERGLLPEN